MTSIRRYEPAEAYDLISPDYLAMLPSIDHETMHRAIMNSSQVWIGSADGKILAVWGLIPPTLLSDIAYLWMFTTKHFPGHEFMLVRHSQRLLPQMLRDYPIIRGHGAIGHDRSLRWLRWLGAEFSEPQGKFLPFEIRAG